MAAATPYDGARDWVHEAFGIGRSNQRWWKAIATLGLLGTIGFAASTGVLAVRSPDRVQRQIVVLDPNLMRIGRMDGRTTVGVLERMFIARAMDWITYLRSRPKDNERFTKDLATLRDMTDAGLYGRIGRELLANKEEFGKSIRDVTDMSANIIDPNDDMTETWVRVWWTESVRKSGIKPASYSIMLKMVYSEFDRIDKFSGNPEGFYVVDAQAPVRVTKESEHPE